MTPAQKAHEAAELLANSRVQTTSPDLRVFVKPGAVEARAEALKKQGRDKEAQQIIDRADQLLKPKVPPPAPAKGKRGRPPKKKPCEHRHTRPSGMFGPHVCEDCGEEL
jgi:hypothetical protein